MVTTLSIGADHEVKRQRLTLEKAKVVTVSNITAIHMRFCLIDIPLMSLFISSSVLVIALKATSDTATVCTA